MANTALQPGKYYHILNRGNNSETLFKSPENNLLFLELYAKYMHPVVDTIAYCLMSNHFHLVIRTKETKDILTMTELKMFENNKRNLITDKKPTASQQFAHLFISYAKTINANYNRTGSLFEHPFERREIDSELYLKRCIAYVHRNPIKAGLVSRISDYKWSSYNGIVGTAPTNLERDFVLNLYNGKKYFESYHEIVSTDDDMIGSRSNF